MMHNDSFCPKSGHCPGSTDICLSDLLNAPMDPREAAVRTLRILDALEERHRLCSLHLNICPKNIYLTGPDPNDPVILSCCGNPCVMGRPCPGSYTAPELVRGTAEPADFSTDLYSVTAVFFHCLMGRQLMLSEVLNPKAPDPQNIPTLTSTPPSVRKTAGKILRRGLHMLPEMRYRSIGSLRRALTELLEMLPQTPS